MSYLKFLICLLIWSKQESVTGIAVKKFVYHQDWSEHCRRRVMPSVFLGRHVVDAYAQILHFSRIELPYSCYISIRTESGSNIILVFQLASDVALANPCVENSDQLLVYEMGETFGGYWGPLPEIFLRSRLRGTTTALYTLKTSASTSPSTTTTETTPTTEETTTPQSSESDDIAEQQDMIELNIPLVNVSAVVVPGEYRPENVFNFDDLYDVMPRENVPYQTAILPLVQFSMKDQKIERLSGNRDNNGKYQFDYNLLFTPDIRLTYPRIRGKTRRVLFPKYKSYVNRRRKPLRRKHPLLTIHDKKSHITRIKLPLERYRTTDSIKSKILTSKTDNGQHMASAAKSVDDIMREFNKSTNYTDANDKEINITALLTELSNMGYNASAYLYPEFQINNLSQSNLNTSGTTSKNSHSFIETSLPFTLQSESNESAIFESSNMEQLTTQFNKDIIINSTQISEVQVSESRNYINKNDIIDDQNRVTENTNLRTTNFNEGNYLMKPGLSSKISSTPKTGSLVDRESWENVVQVAPVMASLLNHSAEDANVKHFDRMNASNATERARKKRHLQPIPIDNAKPHSMTTAETVPTTFSTTFHVSDIQDFFRLVELHDDELHERVALRYLRQYMGPSVFNICEFTEPKSRHVQLFNSSRIVIALTNFTIEKMTVVMTPARTLLNGESRCGTSNLECQVTGTRVCIDSMTACDGVPNCGAYDIFDEDRLMCGAAVGLQHNVWLAAVAFLAVMLTVLYTVHYWLTRCVPKVSKAFFIYLDGDENTLYLDSIMRSPNDTFDGSFDGNLEDEILYNIANKKETKTITCCSWLATFCNKLKKSKKEETLHDNQLNLAKRTFSFTQTEISKIAKKDFADVCVQTNESLEMSDMRKINLKRSDMNINKGRDFRKQSNIADRPVGKWDITSIGSEDKSFLDELSLIKLFKDSKDFEIAGSKEAFLNLALDSNSDNRLRISEEREIQSHVYDRTRRQSVIPTTSSVNSGTMTSEKGQDSTVQTQPKRLRFIEEPMSIPSITAINEGESKEEDFGRLIAELGNKNRTFIELKSNKEDVGQVPSTSRDFKRFFSGGKGKKAKIKKSQTQFR